MPIIQDFPAHNKILHLVRLQNSFSTKKNEIKPTGITWEALKRVALSKHTEREKKDGYAIIGVRFSESHNDWIPTRPGEDKYRNSKNVKAFTFLVYDLDGLGEADGIRSWVIQNKIEATFATTHSYHPTQRPYKWRVIFPLTDEVLPDRWITFWDSVCQWHGVDFRDVCGSKKLQLFYLPSCPIGAESRIDHYSGKWLNPEEIIHRFPPTAIQAITRRKQRQFTQKVERAKRKRTGYWVSPPHPKWRLESDFHAREYFTACGLVLADLGDRLGIESPAGRNNNRATRGTTSSVVFLTENQPPRYFSSRSTDEGWNLPEVVTYCHQTAWQQVNPKDYGAIRTGQLREIGEPYKLPETVPLETLALLQIHAKASIQGALLERAFEGADRNNGIREFLKSLEIHNALCFQWSAGSGKTEMLINLMAIFERDRDAAFATRIEYYVPTKKLQAELYERLIKAGIPPSEINIIYGIAQFLPDCVRRDRIQQRIDIGMGFGDICRTKTTTCPNFDNCPYQKQFLGKYFITILCHPYFFLDWKRYAQPDLVCIDEDFSDPGHTIDTKTKTDIQSVRHLASEYVDSFFRVVEAENQTSAISELDSDIGNELENLVKKLTKRKGKKSYKPTIQELKSLIFISKFFSAALREKHIRREKLNCIQEKDIGQDSLYTLAYRNEIRFNVIRNRENRNEIYQQPVIVMINADADTRILKAHFPCADIKFSVASIKKNATIVQIARWGKSNSRTKLIVEQECRLPKNFQKAVSASIAAKSKTLVITYLPVVEKAKVEYPELFIPGLCEWLYWGGPIRGIDAYKDYDNVFLLGRNLPPTEGTIAKARALYFDSETPFPEYAETIETNRAINCKLQNGNYPCVPVRVPTDSRIAACQEQVVEADAIQAIDRLRLVFSPVKKNVFIWTNYPLPLPVDFVSTEDEVCRALESLYLLKRTGECIRGGKLLEAIVGPCVTEKRIFGSITKNVFTRNVIHAPLRILENHNSKNVPKTLKTQKTGGGNA